MERYHLPLFLLNTLLVLVDVSLGYHLTPRLLSGNAESVAAGAALRATRGLLPAIVALYMFFNCLGYFQARTPFLITVACLVLADLGLQVWLRRRKRRDDSNEEREED
ncbi:MAG: hypothetical protein HYV06_06840 [Deltaproteobacteria bacterium]|nr:hypothetical protein [Deltaproteobacteria bacterium]